MIRFYSFAWLQENLDRAKPEPVFLCIAPPLPADLSLLPSDHGCHVFPPCWAVFLVAGGWGRIACQAAYHVRKRRAILPAILCVFTVFSTIRGPSLCGKKRRMQPRNRRHLSSCVSRRRHLGAKGPQSASSNITLLGRWHGAGAFIDCCEYDSNLLPCCDGWGFSQTSTPFVKPDRHVGRPILPSSCFHVAVRPAGPRAMCVVTSRIGRQGSDEACLPWRWTSCAHPFA
jgi:hypothetical protein